MTCLCTVLFFVFFFKQKTAYEMRISDWSSDVCSSDLLRPQTGRAPGANALGGECPPASACGRRLLLYFAPKGIRTRVRTCTAAHKRKAERLTLLQACDPSPAWPAGLRGEIKEEAFAVGGCRGTFAPKACRPRRARQVAATRAISKQAETLYPESGEVLFFTSFPTSPPRA